MNGDRSIRSFKDLEVWKLSMALAETCYRATAQFPNDELYGMTSQVRRAAVSIPANIAEGYGRETTASFIQFLRVAQGSLKELETHWMLAERIGIAQPEPAARVLGDCERVSKLLRNLIRALQEKSRTDD